MKMVFDIGDYYDVCVVWLLNFQLVIVIISGDPDWNAYTINLCLFCLPDHERPSPGNTEEKPCVFHKKS